MDLLFLILKIVVVAIFLVMFLRSNKAYWGIGLLTVTSAILLDTFLGTLGRAEMIEQLGFFFYVLAGALFAGAAIWLWGIMQTYIVRTLPDQEEDGDLSTAGEIHVPDESPAAHQISTESPPEESVIEEEDLFTEPASEETKPLESNSSVFDIEDIKDVAFDMDYYGSLEPNQSIEQLTRMLADIAADDNRLEELQLAYDRLSTPLPPKHLPRVEKIQADSPRTIIRQYMIANCSMEQLETLAVALGIDWESIPGESARVKVRNLLLNVIEEDQMESLVNLLQNAQ